MSRKPESRLQRNIRRALEAKFPESKFWKIWGGPFQVAGFPDLLGCVCGLFVALEVKQPGEVASEIQKDTIEEIKQAGGISGVVTSDAEAVELVRNAIKGASPRRRFYN